MKHIIYVLLSSVFLFSCTHSIEKNIKMRMDKAFKAYIKENDLQKDYETNLKKVEVLSYSELKTGDKEYSNEKYKALVYMYGTTSLINSAKLYNLNDTVTCYFDESFKMLRLVNPNNKSESD